MKYLWVPVLGLVAISAASAGSVGIEIGAGESGGITTQGLTTGYINSVAQPANGWVGEKSYTNILFSGQSISNSSLTGVAETTPTTAGCTSNCVGTGSSMPTYQNGFQQFVDPNNNVQFGMMDDGANGNNFLASGSATVTGATSIVVPVNQSGLANAYVLLNDYYGVNASATQNDTVLFTFSGGNTLSFTLTNGNQIDGVTHCTSNSTSYILPPTCTQFAKSTTSTSSDNAWTGNYTILANNGASPYAGTNGTDSLLDIGFNISADAGDTLQTITITDSNNQVGSSRLALSAITVTPTPEPASWLLMLSGLGLAIFAVRRFQQVRA
jgi:hypothetical protein